jgi:hypothetical protein
MEKLTYNQQYKLEHLYTLMEFADLLDSVEKVTIFLNQFGYWEDRHYDLEHDTIVEYIFTRMKKWWLAVYCHEADYKYCQLTTKEQRDATGYALGDWEHTIYIEYFDTLDEVSEQAIKDAINKARLNHKENKIPVV